MNKLLFLFCFITTFQVKADSWIDPSWKKMLDDSDQIALVEYSSDGEFRANAKVITTYKGTLNEGEEIWISGFSNRYGPIDKMTKGSRYLVFLNLNKPNKENLDYWKEKLIEEPDLKNFVNAYKNKKSFYVWSPTSGDLKVEDKKIQYDLIQTTYYKGQTYYSLKEFEEFLKFYYKTKGNQGFLKKLTTAIENVNESDLNSQYLMMLYLLEYTKYIDSYESYIKIQNPSSKYALVQIMGNIKTEQSRNVLIALLDDENTIVQGEVVRQLKNENIEIVAPILLNKLKSSAEGNFGPSSLMDPVMNRIDGGKTEIIATLGEWKYKPAVPELLLLLDTDDEEQFNLVIAAIKKIGSKEYIKYINKHLDNKNDKLIFQISMMIADDNLTECLPSFKNYISTCNRNKHSSPDYTISICCGIGKFNDDATVSFLLTDYEKFFTYKDTLDSRNQKSWHNQYIQTFATLKIKEARHSIYKSIFDWHGINEDFGKSKILFEIKKNSEESFKKNFSPSLSKNGYELTHVIAFIENTKEVLAGKNPQLKFLIEVRIPSNHQVKINFQEIIQEIKLPEANISFRYNDGVYHDDIEDRFSKSISSTPLTKFIEYAQLMPNQMDVDFFQNIIDSNFYIGDLKDDIVKAVTEIKKQLAK
ncbi:HEAT repeat domain-containing protein [Flavobacterium soli]|uniref:HEAT repeat domain-containing protein n=1 Tax=Flavobacterium soli TaxID=344881 RepID=UPI000423A73B|nr:hypothetical protein [Flavobacterium soli]